MVEHVKVLAAIGIVRALVAFVLGFVLISKADRLSLRDYYDDRGALESYHSGERDKEDLDFDRIALSVVGGACLGFAALRLAQCAGSLFSARWARFCGLGLAVFDVINLLLFPLSTALGLYSLVVYRHPETAERFRNKRAMVSGAG